MLKNILVLALLASALSDWDGIDVSAWQENIDWGSVRGAGYTFAMIRGGYGQGHQDSYFQQNYNGAKNAGMNVGFYWYSYAGSCDDGTSEANHVLNILSGKQFEYPIMYDIEEGSIFSAGIQNCILSNFCSVLESKGYYCGFYTSLSFLNNYFSEDVKSKYDIWSAQWSSSDSCSRSHGMWQYSSSGSVPGINGRVDMDKAYYDFPSIMKSKHLNGF